MAPQNPCPAAQTLQEDEPARNLSDVDVDQQLLSKSVGGNSHPHDPHPETPARVVALPEAHSDGLISKKSTTPRVSETIVVEFGFVLGSFLDIFFACNLFIAGP